MKFKRKTLLLIQLSVVAAFVPIIATYCNRKGHEYAAEEVADSFALHYFNWQFDKALPYVTDSSAIWLRYAASQVHQADVDALRAMTEDATIETEEADIANDSMVTVNIKVKNYLGMDTIGKAAHMVDEAEYTMHLKQENEKWKVILNGLPTK